MMSAELPHSMTVEDAPAEDQSAPVPDAIGPASTESPESGMRRTPLAARPAPAVPLTPAGRWSLFSGRSLNLTLVNFWLDVGLALLFLVQGWMLLVLHVVFPRGGGPEWTIWGATRLDWSESLFVVYGVFSVGVVLHVMLHWEWICGVVATRFLGRKPGRDDGSQTLIGVGLLAVVIHLLLVGVFVAKMSLATSLPR